MSIISLKYIMICVIICVLYTKGINNIMDKKVENLDIFSKIQNHSIPKWSDLPELDLYMDQVIALMEKYLSDNTTQETKLITPSMINNYVKLGIMPAPIKKKYSREHLAYLIIICSLKSVMPIPSIKAMIDQKLQKNNIAEILDFYSNLYDFTFKTVLKTCEDYSNSSDNEVEILEDTSLFTAIAAANYRNISNRIFYSETVEAKQKKSKKSL